MPLSIQFILAHFSYVFKNEFNERKILHSFVDKSWGSYVAMSYATNTWDFQWRGKDYYNDKCKKYSELERTLVITEDKNGELQLFQFWKDFSKAEYCYSEVLISSELTKEHRESCNAVRKYFV